MVVVPVDQGQLHHGAVAQLGRQAQGDVQPGVARPGDHDPAATPGLVDVLTRPPRVPVGDEDDQPVVYLLRKLGRVVTGTIDPGQPGYPRTWSLTRYCATRPDGSCG